ncbi:MAG: hypothetical protein QXU79_02340, partial [Candidatus Micrarchaeaceae archaeon]
MPIVLLTLEEAAGRYNLDVEHLRQMVAANKIKSVVVDGHTLVDEAEVRRVTGGNGNYLHWIPLKEAAALYNLEEELLKRLAKDGIIRSGVFDGEPYLAVEDVEPVAARLNRANFRDLEGRPIELTQASERYCLPFHSLLAWARRGHIRIIRDRRPMLLDEADVAYTRELVQIRGLIAGKALFPTSRQYCPPWVSKQK